MFLTCPATMLDDMKRLSDYNVQQDSTIHVSIKPPIKDIFSFDGCRVCHFQAIEPCALPCGHSCCKSCIPLDATTCPVVDCKAPLQGLSRDTLPPNWLATQFIDPKPEVETGTKMCQACAENGTQKKATHWCETCAVTSDVEFYCDTCCASEHSSISSRKHARFLLETASTIYFPSPSAQNTNSPKTPIASMIKCSFVIGVSRVSTKHTKRI